MSPCPWPDEQVHVYVKGSEDPGGRRGSFMVFCFVCLGGLALRCCWERKGFISRVDIPPPLLLLFLYQLTSSSLPSQSLNQEYQNAGTSLPNPLYSLTYLPVLLPTSLFEPVKYFFRGCGVVKLGR
jgi:hypothetical protein